MKNENWPSFLVTRHSIKPSIGVDPESSDYKGISEKGVELAKERAVDILDILKKEPSGSILFFLGSSESERTKSTEQVYVNAIKESLSVENKEDISLISKSEIDNVNLGYTENVNVLADRINDNPEKKFIVDVNLFIKELSNSHWEGENSDFLEYLKKILIDNKNNVELCFRDWIENKGISGDLIGPNPEIVAKKTLSGIKRLSEFAKKFLKDKDRNIIIGAVGHSWNLDAAAIYLANNGVVDIEGFDKIKGSIIDETQILRLKKQENDKYSLFYNNNEYNLD